MLKAFLYVSVFSVGLMACQPANPAPDIAIKNAYVRAPLPGQSTAVAYFDIVNKGGKDVLLAARSNASAQVELHNHIHEGGLMKMRQVDKVEVPKNTTLSFESGGMHVMIFGAEINGPVTLTLDFQTHADITIELEQIIN